MSPANLPAVSIVIPNFNGAELLRANLPAVLKAAETYGGACSVTVVDDASADASLAALAEFPAVHVVRHGENKGFADAVHSGVAASQSEILIFLNSDVLPEADFIQPLVRHFADPAVFSVGPLIIDERGEISDVCWRCFTLRGGRLRGVRWSRDLAGLERAPACLFASGGSVALRRSMFEALGGFSPIFRPFYSEDFDLGVRGWRRGWKTLFEPQSRVEHHSRAGSIRQNVVRGKIQRTRIRNRFILEWIHLPGSSLLRMLPGYLRQMLMRLLRMDLDYFRGLFAALRRLPEVRRLRREVEASAVSGFWDVMDTIRRDFGPWLR